MTKTKVPKFMVPRSESPSGQGATEADGSPKFRVARYSKNAVKRLHDMGFDPLEKLVNLYEELEEESQEMLKLKQAPKILPSGRTINYSSMAQVALFATRQKLLNDLMRFGYARVPEKGDDEKPALNGISIGLTLPGIKYPDTNQYAVNTQFDPNVHSQGASRKVRLPTDDDNGHEDDDAYGAKMAKMFGEDPDNLDYDTQATRKRNELLLGTDKLGRTRCIDVLDDNVVPPVPDAGDNSDVTEFHMIHDTQSIAARIKAANPPPKVKIK